MYVDIYVKRNYLRVENENLATVSCESENIGISVNISTNKYIRNNPTIILQQYFYSDFLKNLIRPLRERVQYNSYIRLVIFRKM